jgi:hypothetical protein
VRISGEGRQPDQSSADNDRLGRAGKPKIMLIPTF